MFRQPLERSATEGDVTVQVVATVAEIRCQAAWHAEHGHALAIDPMLRNDIKTRLRTVDLDDLLH